MQTIIVPTDYSTASENAMFCASELAVRLGAELFLFHAYELPISMNDAPVLMIPATELKKNAELGMHRVKETILTKFPGLPVRSETRLGDFIYELNEVCNAVHPLLVIIGSHDEDGLDRFLFGDTLLGIIRNVNPPVITVPDSVQKLITRNILFASDGSARPDQQQQLKLLVEKLEGQLHIVQIHANNDKKEDVTLQGLADLHPVYESLNDDNFMHGLQKYMQTNPADVIVLMPHKHGLLDRLFSKTHTAEAIHKLKVPVLTIS